MGLKEGDRVAGILRNDADAVTMALAAAGATLATVAPELDTQAAIEHFAPLKPKMIFMHKARRMYDTKEVTGSATAVVEALPTLTNIVYLDDTSLPNHIRQRQWELRELISDGDPASFQWPRFSFDHPLFIMASTNVAGEPKRLVHGAGGTLIEHVKEHRLHGDFGPGDKLYVHTNCAWMIWHWQLSALASGVEIVTYDGPVSAIDSLWRFVAQERVTVFSTNPAYLKMCEDARIEPGKQYDFSALRAVVSTSAVLHESQFEWVRNHVKPLPLQSMQSGAGMMGSFALGNPNLPVYAGEAQCKSLGLDVQAFDEQGWPVAKGELVCTNPFPSRPLGFYGDQDGSRFHRAYFAANGGSWTQGENVEFSPQGTARLDGRSDGILNARSIDVSPGEVVRILMGIRKIAQAMLVTQTLTNRIVLLLVLHPGVQLDATLIARVRRELTQVSALPVTHNGKLSDAAAQDAVNGLPVCNLGHAGHDRRQRVRNLRLVEQLQRRAAERLTRFHDLAIHLLDAERCQTHSGRHREDDGHQNARHTAEAEQHRGGNEVDERRHGLHQIEHGAHDHLDELALRYPDTERYPEQQTDDGRKQGQAERDDQLIVEAGRVDQQQR